MITQLKSAPNQLTLLRLATIPFIVIAVLDAHWAWALTLFLLAGISDGLDGLLARLLKQRTMLGAYLDPIADKLLLSTLFLELAFVGLIPWRVTVLVFSRDVIILVVCAALYTAANFRDFTPTIFGKMNTFAQVATVFVILLRQVWPTTITSAAVWLGIRATVILTVISGLHYTLRLGWQLRAGDRKTGASQG
ncbi:MAG: CDP-alcohol phosphatidyltransferase family protein [Acidobacteria bacterium]|nr:CDP-alcohol phosphatidyltransferase family protein [Acidobacteriota bacterium]